MMPPHTSAVVLYQGESAIFIKADTLGFCLCLVHVTILPIEPLGRKRLYVEVTTMQIGVQRTHMGAMPFAILSPC